MLRRDIPQDIRLSRTKLPNVCSILLTSYCRYVLLSENTLTAVQVFLNISVVTNLIPTTGISLPFFSYGGTALMIQLAEMGIILSVSRQIPAPRQE